ncbi:MAG: siderophore-interacting protein [Pseudoclavibacter sp.]|nr:siderophore-interacting protein [Pseudoclavibacter sp.]
MAAPAGFRREMHEPAVRGWRIRRIEDRGARMRRLVLQPEEGPPLHSPGPDDHCKLLVPDESGRVVLPERDERGRIVNRAELTMRDMSICDVHPDGGIVLEVMRHAGGPLGRMTETAGVGQRLVTLGPRGSLVPERVFERYALIADLTGLPALRRWLALLPAGVPVHAVVVCVEEADAVELTTAADLETRWLPLGADFERGGSSAPAELAAQLLAGLPEGEDLLLWAAGEAGCMRRLRDLVVSQGREGLTLGVHGYWRAGTSDFDHHAPLE